MQGSRRARDVAARIDLAGIAAGLLLLPMTAVSAIMMGPISKRNLVRGPLIAGAAACLAGAAGVLFLTTGTPMNHQPQPNQPQANPPQPKENS